ncbi:hypothetical protein PRIPAC_96229 [Pristionchus pacificus]|uniref:Uncharacterized protein n=1 Tax=Pristionchus pacificus TaxID=54126 RepID=A0A2A6BCD1_PRIPA|nr:hypothetical protein PRIPAC_96229 [Pristionchus pacificus]|eukprot:PDM63527.1 hypothetical protein PRIPAC_53884 [Pristionchus pacificus]
MDEESYFMLSKLFYFFVSLVIARAVQNVLQFCREVLELQKDHYDKSSDWTRDDLILLPSTVVFTNVRVNSTFRYSELLTPVSDPQYFFSQER